MNTIWPEGFVLVFVRRDLTGNSNVYALVTEGGSNQLHLSTRPFVSIPRQASRAEVDEFIRAQVSGHRTRYLRIQDTKWGWYTDDAFEPSDAKTQAALQTELTQLLSETFLFSGTKIK